MTTEDERRGALAAIDRILNRGGERDDVLAAVTGVLARLYPQAAIHDGRVAAPDATAADEPFLRRVETLISGL